MNLSRNRDENEGEGNDWYREDELRYLSSSIESLTDLWFDDRLPRQRSSVRRLEFEFAFTWIAAKPEDSVRFPHLPFLPARFLLYLSMPVRFSIIDFPFPCRWLARLKIGVVFPFSFHTLQPVPSIHRLATNDHDSRSLGSLFPLTRWLTYQIHRSLIPPSLFLWVARRLPADWTRLGRPDNPIELGFMDIRKRASRVMRIKEAARRTNIYRGRSAIERRERNSSELAVAVSRLHYANQPGE